MPDLATGPAGTGAFANAIGLQLDLVTGTEVRGYLLATREHHTPWGVVHGGLYSSVIETVASVGASVAVAAEGKFAVGVNNQTDFLRPFFAGRLNAVGTPIQQGRSLQLWLVELTNDDGKIIARGQVRLSNQPLPAAT